MRSGHLRWVAALAAVVGTGAVASGDAYYTLVADTNVVAPSGDNFSGFSHGPAVSADGSVAFSADGLLGLDVWTWKPGSLQAVAQSFSAPPGLPDEYFYLESLYPSIAGSYMAFRGQTTPFPIFEPSRQGIWAGGPGAMQLVALENEQAPGAATGVTFRVLDQPWAGLNAGGTIAFMGRVQGTGVTQTNSQGIWVGTPGSLSLAARTGGAAPGLPGVTYYGLEQSPDAAVIGGFGYVGMNGTGQIIFVAGLDGAGVTTTNDIAIFAGSPGALSVIARTGDRAPGTPAGVYYAGPITGGSISDSGRVGFRIALTGTSVVAGNNDSALYIGGYGGAQLVARTGDRAPGTPTGVLFQDLQYLYTDEAQTQIQHVDPPLSASGITAFNAKLTGTGVDSTNNNGLWVGTPGAVTLLARKGDPAAGVGSDVKWGDLWPPAVNGSGQVAFVATLQGPSISGNDKGIWVTDMRGRIVLLARRGDSVSIGGSTRTLGDMLVLLGNNGEDGVPNGMDSLGRVGITAQFTDGSSAVFVASPAGDKWNAGSGSYQAALSWSTGAVPNAPGETVSFLNAVSPCAVQLDQAATVGFLRFDSAKAFTLSGTTLTLRRDGGPAGIEVVSGSHTLACALAIAPGQTLWRVGQGQLTISGPQSNGAGAVFQARAGTTTFNTDAGTAAARTLTLTASGAGTVVNLNCTQHLAALAVGDGTKVVLKGNGNVVGGLTLSGTGQLDVTTGGIMVKGGSYSAVAALLTAGSIMTSASDAAHNQGLHILAGSDALANGNAIGFNGAGGATISTGDVLVAYGWNGDLNLDGQVNYLDYGAMDNAFVAHLASPSYARGNLNGDSTINYLDYGIMDTAFLAQNAPHVAAAAMNASAVPEPSALGLVGVAVLGIVARRSRRR